MVQLSVTYDFREDKKRIRGASLSTCTYSFWGWKFNPSADGIYRQEASDDVKARTWDQGGEWKHSRRKVDSSLKEQQNQLLHNAAESYQKQIIYLLKLLAVAIDRLHSATKEAASYQSELEALRLKPVQQQPPTSPVVVREEMKEKEAEDTIESKLSCYDKLITELEQTISQQKREIEVLSVKRIYCRLLNNQTKFLRKLQRSHYHQSPLMWVRYFVFIYRVPSK